MKYIFKRCGILYRLPAAPLVNSPWTSGASALNATRHWECLLHVDRPPSSPWGSGRDWRLRKERLRQRERKRKRGRLGWECGEGESHHLFTVRGCVTVPFACLPSAVWEWTVCSVALLFTLGAMYFVLSKPFFYEHISVQDELVVGVRVCSMPLEKYIVLSVT